MRTLSVLCWLTLPLAPLLSLAHGEDKPGPHGGEIRMPGAFHTEAILSGKNAVRIYLLDLHWQNPTVKNSRVEARFSGGQKGTAACKKEKDAFLCTFGKGVNLGQAGKLEIKATRDKQEGVAVEYETPLPPHE